MMAAGSRSDLQYVVSVEFKLRSWQRALRQAFRHRNFVNEAYVVVDHSCSAPALRNIDHFVRANVGLATLERRGAVRVFHYPEPAVPFSTVFAKTFAKNFLAPRKRVPDELPFISSTRGGRCLADLRRGFSPGAIVTLPRVSHG